MLNDLRVCVTATIKYRHHLACLSLLALVACTSSQINNQEPDIRLVVNTDDPIAAQVLASALEFNKSASEYQDIQIEWVDDIQTNLCFKDIIAPRYADDLQQAFPRMSEDPYEVKVKKYIETYLIVFAQEGRYDVIIERAAANRDEMYYSARAGLWYLFKERCGDVVHVQSNAY